MEEQMQMQMQFEWENPPPPLGPCAFCRMEGINCPPNCPMRGSTDDPDHAALILGKFPLHYIRAMFSNSTDKPMLVHSLVEEEVARFTNPVHGIAGQIQDLQNQIDQAETTIDMYNVWIEVNQEVDQGLHGHAEESGGSNQQ